MCGRSFSGKSTLARPLGEFLAAELISLDSINEERGLRGGDGIPLSEWIVTNEEASRRAHALLDAGRSVVVDDTSSARFLRDGWRALAASKKAGFALVYVDAPEALLRARLEENRRILGRHDVTDDVMHEHLATFEVPAEEERAVAVDALDVNVTAIIALVRLAHSAAV
jgi:predicted kinase